MTEKNVAPLLPRRPGALNSLGRIREEMGTLYRDAREGRIETRDATRLAYCLTALAKLVEGENLEARLEALEHKLETQNWGRGSRIV